jgi:type IV pilus assembly protein PilV
MNGRHNIDSRISRQSGTSLFEVLIAIVVLSIGLLGLAGAQATGLMNNQGAYHTSQATVLAYDMADRMRANTESITNYLTKFKTLEEAEIIGPKMHCKDTAGECGSALMAQNDLFEWNSALKAALPDPTGTIALAGDIYTITLRWDDNRDGVIDTDDPSFQVSFQP